MKSGMSIFSFMGHAFVSNNSFTKVKVMKV